MCDFFWQRVETTDQGDLADIVRASGVPCPATSSKIVLPSSPGTFDSWQPVAATAFLPLPADDNLNSNPLFGNLRNPLLHELTGNSGFGPVETQKICFEDEMNSSCGNLFSRVLQISPDKSSPLSPTAIRPLSTVDHGMQISSPRAPGVKRRKSQAKKVVCIPAPAAASNRPSGEVVPSDLWAWRKYGQKPIKGSPYPRGYYRCSSSKGCSARKQVERSRTDPNMLVITYTSEHNHPWPTQRNALAGSTRAQPTKNQRMTSSANAMKEELIRETTTITTSSSLATVKEEIILGEKAEVNINDRTFDQMFYNDSMMDEWNQSDDFFADLAELDPDPMSLIFNWGGTSLGDQAK